jgi:hypothetical protein
MLVAAQGQRHTAMHAVLVENPNPARGVTEHHQALTEQRGTQRAPIGFPDLRRRANRQPESPHHAAHRSLSTHLRQNPILVLGKHSQTRPSIDATTNPKAAALDNVVTSITIGASIKVRFHGILSQARNAVNATRGPDYSRHQSLCHDKERYERHR